MWQQSLKRTLGAALLLAAGLTATLGAPAGAQGVDQRDLLRISNYLNGLTTLAGDFVQIDAEGGLSRGTFTMRRPGRLRFDYRPPNPALIVADGTWVGVCDRELESFERYPLEETPLDLLLRDRVDFRTEGAVQAITRGEGQLRVRAIDPDAPDQGSITMIFTEVPLALTQWVVVDAQGLTTTVALSDTRSNVSVNPELFVIEEGDCTGF
ncbi:outer membrane lipoprotein carrier protein LolA [Paralimibaculum aggregatum]|uniref:Outer membrane lipoprotein carrier protein LolA n=1 Tax=Paralimibaculum aggregatum TaxID=3036245 RepID=A0ABQ6LBW2_9RHOB|nr:outer membrane lipoprotein carrier protein LolA [Limibaculum sp. NKW23]GMG80884.1 outer membrane lipoprotein carrier protein LolA [Limibaculum sp. NKW23]